MTEMTLEGLRTLQDLAESDEDWSGAVGAYLHAIIETEEKFAKRNGKIVEKEAIDWDE